MSRDLPPLPVHGFDLPESPADFDVPPAYPEPVAPPKRRRNTEGTPREKPPHNGDLIGKKAGIIHPNSREATDEDLKEQRIKSPLRGHADPRGGGQAMGAGFAKLSGADMQRVENQIDAINRGIAGARAWDQATTEGARDPDFLRSLGFWGRSEEDD